MLMDVLQSLEGRTQHQVDENCVLSPFEQSAAVDWVFDEEILAVRWERKGESRA